MDKERGRLLKELIQHRKKATELLRQGVELHEQAKNGLTLEEHIAEMEKVIELNKQVYAENIAAEKLSEELQSGKMRK